MNSEAETTAPQSNEPRKNFILSLKWVRQGVAIENPEKVQLTKDELAQIIEATKEKLRTYDEGESTNQANEDEYNFSNYDNNDEGATLSSLGVHSLIEIPENVTDNFSDSDDSEKEDDLIKKTDNLILVGHVEGDASVLEIYIYNEQEEALYVHHDLLLPSFPLCLEWLNYEPNQPKGNYCAVGTMEPIIEVFDLDIMNGLEPAFKLGKKFSKKKKTSAIGHKAAVTALAWNENFDHVIASGSADKTILLWDMEHQIPSSKIESFTKEIFCLEWHQNEGQTLIAGGGDKCVKLFDCRAPENHLNWDLNGGVEKLLWNPQNPSMFLVGTDKGTVFGFDYRMGNLWSVDAHNNEITGLAISKQCPGLLLTASREDAVKIWDLTGENQPRLVHENDFHVGNINSIGISPDSPFVVSIGGDNKLNNFIVFNLLNIDTVKNTFGSRDLIQLQTANVGNTVNQEDVQME